jgi:hypothetical protein
MIRAAGVALVALLLFAAPAHASNEQAFLDAVAVLGYNDPADALSAGYAVCSMNKAVGLSLTERILRRILNRMDAAVHANNASPFAQAATDHLCPRFG